MNTGALNVRKQPDPDADKLVSYPCIKQNTEVGVCGSAKAPNGALWYYIYIDGAKGKKYGICKRKIHHSEIRRKRDGILHGRNIRQREK